MLLADAPAVKDTVIQNAGRPSEGGLAQQPMGQIDIFKNPAQKILARIPAPNRFQRCFAVHARHQRRRTAVCGLELAIRMKPPG